MTRLTPLHYSEVAARPRNSAALSRTLDRYFAGEQSRLAFTEPEIREPLPKCGELGLGGFRPKRICCRIGDVALRSVVVHRVSGLA